MYRLVESWHTIIKIEIELWFRLEYNSNQLKEREGEDKTQDRELLQMILTTVLDVQSDVKELQEEMKEVKADIRDMKVDIQDTKDDVRGLREEAVDLRSSIKSIETTLENEIAHGIKIIAEAHFDLHRKLHEALKITNEEELIALRVTNLEKEMREVKERIDKIA